MVSFTVVILNAALAVLSDKGLCVWLWGGGDTHPFLSSTDHQEKRRRLSGLAALADSCRVKKDNTYSYPPSPRVFLLCNMSIILYV